MGSHHNKAEKEQGKPSPAAPSFQTQETYKIRRYFHRGAVSVGNMCGGRIENEAVIWYHAGNLTWKFE